MGTPRQYRLYILIAGALFLPSVFLFIYRAPLYRRLPVWAAPAKAFVPPNIPENDPPGTYDWKTQSAFDPPRVEDVDSKSIRQLCESFPTHLLDRIQPVLKTGHGVLDTRVTAQLHGLSACLSNLLIFSDLEEDFEDHHIYDVIRQVPEHLTEAEPQLKPWHDLNNAAQNGTLGTFVPGKRDGWKVDKFKFLSSVSVAWDMRPNRDWYIFYEADTYIVWDTLFRLLDHFDPDEPLYFGSPSPGRENAWFANGGPGAILSRGAVRKVVAKDHDPNTGEFLGSKLSEQEWDSILHDCCGDSLLGWALATRGVALSGLYPLFNPHPPHDMPFSTRHWCQPVMTMHKPLNEDVMRLWRWQFAHRTADEPLLYRDLALIHHNLTTITRREDWNNGGLDTFPPPPLPNDFFSHDPHASADACESACNSHDDCFQWRYHLRECAFTRLFRLGSAREAGLDKGELKKRPPGKRTAPPNRVRGSWSRRDGEDEVNPEDYWEHEDLRYISGWNSARIQKWVDNHPCEKTQWVRPSIKRIF